MADVFAVQASFNEGDPILYRTTPSRCQRIWSAMQGLRKPANASQMHRDTGLADRLEPGFSVPPRAPIGNTDTGGATATLFLSVCLGLAIVGLIEPLASLFARVSTDYGEGFNAYWAAAAMAGPQALYAPAHVMVANNYPPLSFYLIGALGRIVGDNVFAGRIVALAAMIATAVLSGRAATLLGATVRWGWITGLLLLACAEQLFGHYVAMDNPQWLAQAVMLGGVLPLIRHPGEPGRRACLGSAVTIVVALLIKHNLLAFPLASALWLGAYHRRAFIRWMLYLAAAGAVAGAALLALYGPAIFIEIIAFSRTVDWQNFGAGLVKSECFIPMLLVLAAMAGRAQPDQRWVLFALAGALGVMSGVVQRLGAGVYTNAQFEALVGLVIVSGFAFGAPGAAWREPFGSLRWRRALLAALLIPSLIPLPQHIVDWSHQIATRQATRADWARTIADVHDAREPVLCEIPAICYWAGKPFIVDFFAYGQKLRTSPQPPRLYNAVLRQDFAIIILDRSFLKHDGEPRLPAPLPGLIERRYRAIRVFGMDDISEMVPRQEPRPLL